MEDRVSVLGMAGPRDIGQALYERLRLAHHQSGYDFVVQALKEFVVADKISAVQQRDGELHIACIETITVRQCADCGADLHPQIPHLLGESADVILERSLAFLLSVQEKQIHVGMREEPATAKTA